jgi:predicted RND superfamily exporter protein
MSERTIPPILKRLGELQSRYPWHFLAIALLTLLPASYGIFGAGGLGFKSSFSELLPDNKDSVIEARRVGDRLAGASTLTIVAETHNGPNPDALKRFVNTLVPKLEALGPDKVGAVDYGVKKTQDFFGKNKVLYADIKDVRKAHEEVIQRYDYEVAKARGDFVDEAEAPTPLTADSIEERIRGKSKDATAVAERYPDGYYMHADGNFIAVLVRTPVTGDDAKAAFRTEIEQVVASVNPTSFDPSMDVNYTGNFITSAEEYDAVIGDLMHVGGWGLAGVLASVLLFFMRIRTVAAMGITITISLLWTFGLTRLTIGHLNSSTGFLVSIIAGNGINYSIMYMARYIEARRDDVVNVADAILVAHRDSWLPTLAGSATAMLAYGSLTITDFRGFKHFGVISGYGMILCWVATYLFLPAVLAASERILPSFHKGEKPSIMRGYYGVLFAKLARLAPRPIALVGAALGAVALVAAAQYLINDPMEYDMANVRNERIDRTSAGLLSVRVDKVVGRMGQDGMAIMTDRLDQVPMLEAELNKRWAKAPDDLKPFEEVVSIYSLIPKDQPEKIKLVSEMRDRLQRARDRGFVNDADWDRLQPHIPAETLEPITVASLPEQVVRPFTERDGTRGRIVYIVPKNGFSVWDAHYLMRWADSYRYTTLPTGEVIKGSGSAVIFADMIQTVGEDAPKAIAVSAAGSILVILLAFRFRRQAWGVFLPWLGGIAGLLAFLYFADIKLNFLNFVTIPITIGIGAEYAHNLMQRYRIEGPDQVYRVVVETGGAVILCALTTTLGYLALTLSINRGIVSFGLAAAAGEITCTLAAVLVLPAFLFWLADRQKKQRLDEEKVPPFFAIARRDEPCPSDKCP